MSENDNNKDKKNKGGRPPNTTKQVMLERRAKEHGIEEDMLDSLVLTYSLDALNIYTELMQHEDTPGGIKSKMAEFILEWTVKIHNKQKDEKYKEFLSWREANKAVKRENHKKLDV